MIYDTCCNSPWGTLRIVCEDDRILELRRCDHPVDGHSPTPLSDLAARQIAEYLAGDRRRFDLPILPKGTPFQMAVWEALLKIPYGETRTYQDIADAIGKPRACRAVGMACSRNPIWIIIPCHRVVGKNRSLTGYAGGLDMKQALLELEAVNMQKSRR